MLKNKDNLIKIGIILLDLAIWLWIGWAILKGRNIPSVVENAPEKQLEGIDNELIVGSNCLRAMANPIYLGNPYKVLGVITGYSSTPDQTDSTPFITASGQIVEDGIVANNCYPFGTIIEIDGKVYEVQDRLNLRYPCHYWDIWFSTRQKAKEVGKKVAEIIIYQ